jgi:mono/diheme cytochrome c family protein
MKSSIKIIAAVIPMALSAILFSSFQQPAKPWVVPDNFLKVVNPEKADQKSYKEGKELYMKHCQSCHGKTGLGDGSKAAQLKSEPGDFSLASFQKQSDGSLYYKITEGRNDMPSFKKKLADSEDMWELVNYIRTLKK